MWMLYCYLIGFIPLIVAASLWYFSKKVTWWEALILPVITTLVILLFHYFAIKGMTDDIQTLSGKVCEAVFIPQWLEYYEYAVYRTETYTTTETDSKGNSYTVTHTREVFDHWEPTTRMHYDNWKVSDELNGTYDVQKFRYDDICKNFGAITSRKGCRSTWEHNSRLLSGDPNDYPSVNKNNYVYPVNCTKTFENRVKACPSVFSYAKVPENTPVFEYPKNIDTFTSGRILGKVGVTLYNWDQMNARLGFAKKVNVIAIGFGDESMEIAQLQEAKWIGGKKNDIVICFGGGTIIHPSWCYVFGWSESDKCKLNLQDIIIKNGMNNETIPMIEKEIWKNFTIKDWKKFDYLTVEMPFKLYIWLLFSVICVSIGWGCFAWFNDETKT